MANPKNWVFTQVFDPRSKFILQLNSLSFVVGLINFFLDPLFMYIPSNSSETFLYNDLHLGAILAILRTIGDLFRFFNIIIKFRTAYEDPCSKVFKKRRLVEEPRAIAIKYLKSTFIVDLFAALPLLQAYIWLHILSSNSALTTGKGAYSRIYRIFWLQLPSRLFVVGYASKSQIPKTSGVLMKSAMLGAFYNLLSFMTLSNHPVFTLYVLHQVFTLDMLLPESRKAMSVHSRKFNNGFCLANHDRCSLGQNFTTSFFTWETIFSIIITLFGLIFFADLITRMQSNFILSDVICPGFANLL
ncbi:putative cyclic nucleotide-gated ion channel 15 [Beta vulgaris subsp. vulgaris]|uniref:putative cyclic nucleotide-gated ion channel 15 n=1 Tax=Beta vulgaris subsp. vulgaris TaxID=3555 RepID=UPI0020375919|nr:putative cyclic nucleotide-gated ion channel 15 [Beta vulgaris subsp. vulgaris]